MNKVILMGRIVKDPDIRYSTGGNAMCIASMRLAVDKYKKEDGADFFNLKAFGKRAEFCEKYLKTGTKVIASGRLENNNYTNKEGRKVYDVQIVVEEIEFAESKKQSEPEAEKGEEVAPAVPDGFVHVPDEVADSNLPFV